MPISSKTRLVMSKMRHAAWNAHRRCTNTSDRHYYDYGGRGIEFRFSSVDACRAYLLTLPGHDDLSLWIDRIDNEGHYEVGNLQFTTRGESQKNRRRSRPTQNKFSLIPYYRGYGFDKCFSKLLKRGLSPGDVARLYCISRSTVNRVLGRYS